MRIKNWDKFQHFKDRRPPWIKLYRDILDDPDWHELDGGRMTDSKMLVMLWLIASEHDGNLPDLRKLAFRLRPMTVSEVKETLIRLSHWVEHDIKMISDRYHGDTPETETYSKETETEVCASHTHAAHEKKPANRKTAKTTLPADWRPPNLPPDQLPEFERFCDSARAHARTYANWDAAWRNWISSPFQHRKTTNGPARPSPITKAVDNWIDHFEREAARDGSPQRQAPAGLLPDRRRK